MNTRAGIAKVCIKLPNIPEIKCDVLICSYDKAITVNNSITDRS